MNNIIKKKFYDVVKVFVTILGTASALIALNNFIYNQEKYEIKFEILSDINVLEINEDITKLDILYNGNSLKNNSEKLRIISFRIANYGTNNILKEHYDENDPFGFIVEGGRIIEKPQLMHTSNEYLYRNISLNIDSITNKVTISKVILEPNENYIIKILVLHKDFSPPKVLPVGKIAGIKFIETSEIIESKDERSFFLKVIEGNIFIQIVRLLIYFIVAIVAIVIIVLISSGISKTRKTFKNRKTINSFKQSKDYDQREGYEIIFKRFRKVGAKGIFYMDSLIADTNELNEIYNNILNDKKKKDKISVNFQLDLDDSLPVTFHHDGMPVILNEMFFINNLIEDGIVFKDNGKLLINTNLKYALNKFVNHIKTLGLINEKSKRNEEIIVN